MRTKIFEQINFSTILFDTIFGLILFFSLDSFLEIQGVANFIFYIFSVIIVAHWWLIFRSADDAFSGEVTDSAVDLAFGLVYMILLEYGILFARSSNMKLATVSLAALLTLDIVWALVWKYVGSWNNKDETQIKLMDRELTHNIWVDLTALAAFLLLILFFAEIPIPLFVTLFILVYCAYVVITFKFRIIDLRVF